jgi:hypothetical protein
MVDNKHLYPMEIVCAWCGCHLRWGSCFLPGKVSHGICDYCKIQALEEIEQIYSEKEAL